MRYATQLLTQLSNQRQLLYQETLGADQTNLDPIFPKEWPLIKVEGELRSTRAGNASDALRCQVGDGSLRTGNIYYSLYDPRNFSDIAQFEVTQLLIGRATAATAGGGDFATLQLLIANIQGWWPSLDGAWKAGGFTMPIWSSTDADSSDADALTFGGLTLPSDWTSLDRVRLFLSNGDFESGSSISVYGYWLQ